MSQGTKQQAVRLPVELHAKIVAAATENNRSGHAEMLHRLEQSFTESNGVVDMVRGDLNALEERLLKKLAPEMFITSVHIDTSDVSDADLAEMLKSSHYPGYEFPLRRGTTSPTGRLSESQPEISGLNTLPQAMRKRDCMCGGGYVSGTSLGPDEVPAILTIPGALEWDRPGEETGWRVHDGISPIGLCISADTLVEVQRNDGTKLPADRAGDFGWKWAAQPPGENPSEIYAWRLVPGQAEYPEGWIENTGVCPVEGSTRVEVKWRGGGESTTDVRADGVRWDRLDNEQVDITHWRLSK